MDVPRRRPVRRLKHRLSLEAYRGEVAATFTACIAGKRELFTDSDTVAIFLGALRRASIEHQCQVLIYCFMPDHVHLLASTAPGTSFIDFIRHFKQLSAYRLRCQLQGNRPIWQPRFYDHALRSEEGLLAAARYIWDNPVRAGLAHTRGVYAYSGSFVWPEALSGSEDPELRSVRSDERAVIAAHRDR